MGHDILRHGDSPAQSKFNLLNDWEPPKSGQSLFFIGLVNFYHRYAPYMEIKLVWGSKTIIDDILLWCDKKDLTLLLFTCVCEVFQKYRVSFRLDKCEF